MTAKESFNSFVFTFAPFDDAEFVGHLKRLLGQACLEQRENCLYAYKQGDWVEINECAENILNAKQPEL